MDYPQPVPELFVHTWSKYGVASEVAGDGGLAANSSIWVQALKTYYVPIKLPWSFRAKRIYIVNGATASGNLDLGIYSKDGTRIFNAGSTAQAGTSAPQYVTITNDILLPPGYYYLAAVMDGIVGTFLRSTPGISTMKQAGILQQVLGALPLPATATFATPATDAVIPFIGITSTDSGF